jgi:D-glycero-alpha-D-manno-heptose-7-phosphate kinase
VAQNGTYVVRPMVLPRERLEALQDHLLLVFTGIARNAVEVAETVVGNFKRTEASMHTLRQMVDQAIRILSSPGEDLGEFGKLLKESWVLKRSLSDRVSNSTVDNLMQTAMDAGAVGGKLLGAGGGGFALLFVPPEARARVQEALKHLIFVPFRFEMAGSRIVLYQPDGL